MSENTDCPVTNYYVTNHNYHVATWMLLILLSIVIGLQLRSCSLPSLPASKFESQVRQWAKEYPSDLRNRWAWCYLDSAENWSTDQKLREDVRLKSTQVLTHEERQTLIPLDDKIADAVPIQKTPLVETYYAVGNGLKVDDWQPTDKDGGQQTEDSSEDIKPPDPKPPIRRRLFRR